MWGRKAETELEEQLHTAINEVLQNAQQEAETGRCIEGFVIDNKSCLVNVDYNADTDTVKVEINEMQNTDENCRVACQMIEGIDGAEMIGDFIGATMHDLLGRVEYIL